MNAKSSVWLIHWIGEKLIRHPKNWYLCGFADEVNTALLSLREIWLMEVVKSLKILYCILDLAFWQWTRLSVLYRVGYSSWKVHDSEWRSIPIQAMLLFGIVMIIENWDCRKNRRWGFSSNTNTCLTGERYILLAYRLCKNICLHQWTQLVMLPLPL